jgi:hypothetical protein
MRNLFDRSLKRADARIAECELSRPLSDAERIHLTRGDVLGTALDPAKSSAIRDLLAMTGLQEVKDSVLGLVELAKENFRSEEAGESVQDIPLHCCFLGNPGTGKTTVAKLYGRILCELGFVSSGEVVVKGASELTGSAMGGTAKAVNDLMDSVSGKVGTVSGTVGVSALLTAFKFLVMVAAGTRH